MKILLEERLELRYGVKWHEDNQCILVRGLYFSFGNLLQHFLRESCVDRSWNLIDGPDFLVAVVAAAAADAQRPKWLRGLPGPENGEGGA